LPVLTGVVTHEPEHDPTPDHFVQRASRASLVAKDAGKNRVVLQAASPAA